MKTLSDEMNLIHCTQCGTDKYLCFSKKDVKQFINNILNILDNDVDERENYIYNKINELAGEELAEKVLFLTQTETLTQNETDERGEDFKNDNRNENGRL